MTRPDAGRILLAHVIPVNEPGNIEDTAAATPLAAHLLANWRTHMPRRDGDGSGDFEDFWETAARLTAALESGADEVWLYDHNHETDAARLVGSNQPPRLATTRPHRSSSPPPRPPALEQSRQDVTGSLSVPRWPQE